MENFNGNSNASKGSATTERRVIKPVTTNVTEKKAKGLSKFKKRMFSDEASSVGESVVSDVIIPKVQGLIVDALKYTIDFIFYGKTGANNPNRRNGVNGISYSSFYRSSGTATPQIPANAYNRPNSIYQIKDIVFNERSEAEDVLLAMIDTIGRYGSVTVGDFYDMIGQHGSYTDLKYGWRDLGNAAPVRSGSGWVIDFPKVIPLDQ